MFSQPWFKKTGYREESKREAFHTAVPFKKDLKPTLPLGTIIPKTLLGKSHIGEHPSLLLRSLTPVFLSALEHMVVSLVEHQ